ncbi:hypothetical protein ACIQOW_27890 [Kitasatospora sp. NPDC091335]|uniref:hypothetical protein n=1 Tax=Kitasatospora sp. NPDC091335 TaxID=3364085 RepID=UPI00381AC47B
MTTEPAEPAPAEPAASGPAEPAVPAAPAAPAVPPPPAAPPAAPPVAPGAGESAAPAEPVREAPAPRAPRRPRPVLLTVCALVLGTLAGGGVGYAVQAQRPPTPLPPLQAARPSYPAETVDAAALAAEQPKPLAIDGDLTKLLISAPEGSTSWEDYPDKPSWISIGELAEQSGRAAERFKDLASTGFRRAAAVDWKKDDVKYRVQLVQYTADHADEAKAVTWPQTFAENANGGYKVYPEAHHWAETTEQYYYGQAIAKRGTVQMTVEVFAPKPVNPDTLKDLAKRQWERLA